MHDTRLEERLQKILRAEGDSLPLTLTQGQLEQRLRLRRSERANRRLILATAAALVVALGAGGGFLALQPRSNAAGCRQLVAIGRACLPGSFPVVLPGPSRCDRAIPGMADPWSAEWT